MWLTYCYKQMSIPYSYFFYICILLAQREVAESSKLAILPTTYRTLAPVAKEYSLACIQLPPDVSTRITFT